MNDTAAATAPAAGQPAEQQTNKNTDAAAAGKPWYDSFPEDLKASESLKKFKDPVMLAKSYLNLEKMNGNSIRLPRDDMPQAEKQAVLDDIFAKLGRPESADKYQYARPELPAAVPYNEHAVKAFMGEAHKNGMTQQQLQFALDFHNKYVADTFYEHERSGKEAIAKAEAELKQTWGEQGYKKNTDVARRALSAFADAKDVEFIEKSGLGNDPRLVKLFANIGKKMLESKAIDSAQAPEDMFFDRESVDKEITRLFTDKGHKYHKAYRETADPQHAEAVAYFHKLIRIKAEA